MYVIHILITGISDLHVDSPIFHVHNYFISMCLGVNKISHSFTARLLTLKIEKKVWSLGPFGNGMYPITIEICPKFFLILLSSIHTTMTDNIIISELNFYTSTALIYWYNLRDLLFLALDAIWLFLVVANFSITSHPF